MRPRQARADDMRDRHSADRERVGNQRAVAPPRYGLGAYQGEATAPSELQHVLQGASKRIGLHVIGVAAKRLVAPRAVGRVPPRTAQAAERWQMNVADSRCLEGVRKRAGLVLRIAPRAWDGANVGEGGHPMVPQECKEVLDRSR